MRDDASPSITGLKGWIWHILVSDVVRVLAVRSRLAVTALWLFLHLATVDEAITKDKNNDHGPTFNKSCIFDHILSLQFPSTFKSIAVHLSLDMFRINYKLDTSAAALQVRRLAEVPVRLAGVLDRGLSIRSPQRARLALHLARVGYGASVSHVSIDATKLSTLLTNNALHHKVSATLAGTGPTAPRNLAIVLSIKVRDMDRSLGVKLDDLV